jgi:hypothetical protein
MRKLQVKHWQHLVIGLVGAWFAVSPWLLKLQADSSVAAVSVILGLALIASAIASIVKQHPAEDWVTAGVGLVAAVTPWLVGFASNAVATRTAEASGLICLLLALWALEREGEFSNWTRDRLAR